MLPCYPMPLPAGYSDDEGCLEMMRLYQVGGVRVGPLLARRHQRVDGGR